MYEVEVPDPFRTLYLQLVHMALKCFYFNDLCVKFAQENNMIMRKVFIMALAVLCFSLQLVHAQKDESKFYEARRALEEKDVEKAVELLEENIQENNRHIESYFLLAAIYRHDESYGDALSVIDQALEYNHKKSGYTDAHLLWWKATIFEEMEYRDLAMDTYNQAVKAAGRDKDKDGNLINILEAQAQLYYDMGNYDEADNVYERMRKLDYTNQLPMVGLARNMVLREEYDKALELLDECARYDPDYSEIYKFQALAYEGKKEYRKMIDALITGYEKSDDVDFLMSEYFLKDSRYAISVVRQKIADGENPIWALTLSDIYSGIYKYGEAVELVTDLIEEYGKEPILFEERSELYMDMGMFDLALADIKAAMEMSSGDDAVGYCLHIGLLYGCMGEYQTAIDNINTFMERYPSMSIGYKLRGLMRKRSGNLEGALEDYDFALVLDEENLSLYEMRGRLYLEMGMKELADADFQAIVVADSLGDEIDDSYYAYHFLGDDETAIDKLESVMASDPDNPDNWYEKACLMSLMGREDEAVDALEKAFEKGWREFVHLGRDSDVDPIRGREDFKALVARYEELFATERQRYETAVEGSAEPLVTEVGMKKVYGGTYEIPCSVNGLPLNMVFDTGASDVTISSVEANFMLKNGYLASSDIKGTDRYMTASGDILEGTVIKLKEVTVGDAVLKNIDASVVHSQKAPLLLGQSVLERFGTITVDNVNSKLIIRQ